MFRFSEKAIDKIGFMLYYNITTEKRRKEILEMTGSFGFVIMSMENMCSMRMCFVMPISGKYSDQVKKPAV